MTKYFYTDPLEAAYMAKHYGMKFYWFNDKWLRRGAQSHLTLIGYAYNANKRYSVPSKFYVDPDSLHILEPQVVDVVLEEYYDDFQLHHIRVNWISEIVLMGGLYAKNFDKAKQWTGSYNNNERLKIIQRNGKAFFMPEVEHD